VKKSHSNIRCYHVSEIVEKESSRFTANREHVKGRGQVGKRARVDRPKAKK